MQPTYDDYPGVHLENFEVTATINVTAKDEGTAIASAIDNLGVAFPHGADWEARAA